MGFKNPKGILLFLKNLLQYVVREYHRHLSFLLSLFALFENVLGYLDVWRHLII